MGELSVQANTWRGSHEERVVISNLVHSGPALKSRFKEGKVSAGMADHPCPPASLLKGKPDTK